MSEYEIGKEMQSLQLEMETTKRLIEQLYAIVEHNISEGKIEEPKEKKVK